MYSTIYGYRISNDRTPPERRFNFRLLKLCISELDIYICNMKNEKVEIKLELTENELQKLNELSSKASMTMDEYLENAFRMYLHGDLMIAEMDEYLKRRIK